MSTREYVVKIIEDKFNANDTLGFEISTSRGEFYAVEAFSKENHTRFPLYHWIVDADLGEVWVADSKLPFIVNVALIQRGAGIPF